MNRDVRVAGLAPRPLRDVVVNRPITTSFDLALTQRHQAALASYIASLSNTGVAELPPLPHAPRSTPRATGRRARRRVPSERYFVVVTAFASAR